MHQLTLLMHCAPCLSQGRSASVVSRHACGAFDASGKICKAQPRRLPITAFMAAPATMPSMAAQATMPFMAAPQGIMPFAMQAQMYHKHKYMQAVSAQMHCSALMQITPEL